MPTYKTPDVYTEEVSTLPPSVAEVSTAIPAFIGVTEKGDIAKPVRISTKLEFELIFGGPDVATYGFTVKADSSVSLDSNPILPVNILYYAIDFYFRNGGSDCYIVPVGHYSGTTNGSDEFNAALSSLSLEDEPTLLVFTDVVNRLDTLYYGICTSALAQCESLKDRFCIFDVRQDDRDSTTKKLNALKFRNAIGMNSLKYGAAYAPFLQTSLVYAYDEDKVILSVDTSLTNITVDENHKTNLAAIKKLNTSIYNQIKSILAQQYITLPPSSAVAGAFCAVDLQRGVWKAPANISLNNVIAPTDKIDNKQQEDLNVDSNSGKSINIIRSFSGRGTLIWGARTLAGNDNEWRYVSVRRLFNTIEESTKKASMFAVFEGNDATTWLKVKGSIESYLYGLWQKGALAGSAPDKAYFVHVGLGKTMTQQDILEGRMIVEIGIAAVRPAEFIILRFSHKLQEA